MIEIAAHELPCPLRAEQQSVGAVFRIACPPLATLGTTDFETLARSLATLILATQDRADDATIVLDVVDASIVPVYVDLAVAQLTTQRARLGLIVVCAGETSHDVDSSLPQALREAIGKVNRSGSVWNPLLQRTVQGWPHAQP